MLGEYCYIGLEHALQLSFPETLTRSPQTALTEDRGNWSVQPKWGRGNGSGRNGVGKITLVLKQFVVKGLETPEAHLPIVTGRFKSSFYGVEYQEPP